MMTWCFARNYLQPNTHWSGSPPLAAHMVNTGSYSSQCICIHNDPTRLTGRGLWHQDAHSGLSTPLTSPHTGSPGTRRCWPSHFHRGLSQYLGALCVRYTDCEEHKYRETSRVRWGEQFVLPRPNTSSRPCDWLRFYLKTCQMFKYLPDSWHKLTKVSVSSPDMSKAKDQGWMFDSGLSA